MRGVSVSYGYMPSSYLFLEILFPIYFHMVYFSSVKHLIHVYWLKCIDASVRFAGINRWTWADKMLKYGHGFVDLSSISVYKEGTLYKTLICRMTDFIATYLASWLSQLEKTAMFQRKTDLWKENWKTVRRSARFILLSPGNFKRQLSTEFGHWLLRPISSESYPLTAPTTFR